MVKFPEIFSYLLVWRKKDLVIHFPMVGEGEGECIGLPVSITNYIEIEDLKKCADVRMTKIVHSGLPADAFWVVGSERVDSRWGITEIQPCRRLK